MLLYINKNCVGAWSIRRGIKRKPKMATQTLTIFVIAYIHEIPKEFGGLKYGFF